MRNSRERMNHWIRCAAFSALTCGVAFSNGVTLAQAPNLSGPIDRALEKEVLDDFGGATRPSSEANEHKHLRGPKGLAATPTQAYKMTTPIGPGIAVPDKIESSIGTLNLRYGYPESGTVEKIFDNLDRSRALTSWRYRS